MHYKKQEALPRTPRDKYGREVKTKSVTPTHGPNSPGYKEAESKERDRNQQAADARKNARLARQEALKGGTENSGTAGKDVTTKSKKGKATSMRVPAGTGSSGSLASSWYRSLTNKA